MHNVTFEACKPIRPNFWKPPFVCGQEDGIPEPLAFPWVSLYYYCHQKERDENLTSLGPRGRSYSGQIQHRHSHTKENTQQHSLVWNQTKNLLLEQKNLLEPLQIRLTVQTAQKSLTTQASSFHHVHQWSNYYSVNAWVPTQITRTIRLDAFQTPPIYSADACFRPDSYQIWELVIP
jgi:hypothetical protein